MKTMWFLQMIGWMIIVINLIIPGAIVGVVLALISLSFTSAGVYMAFNNPTHEAKELLPMAKKMLPAKKPKPKSNAELIRSMESELGIGSIELASAQDTTSPYPELEGGYSWQTEMYGAGAGRKMLIRIHKGRNRLFGTSIYINEFSSPEKLQKEIDLRIKMLYNEYKIDRAAQSIIDKYSK